MNVVSAPFAPSLVKIAALPPEDVFTAVNSAPHGLSQAEAQARLAQFGRNRLQEARKTPLIYKFLANFIHLMALLLWTGGALAFLAQMPQLGVAIWAVILINAVFSFWQEFKAERATEALRKLLPSYARVVRDGQEQQIMAEEVVPGDLLVLTEGDHIPADGRFVEEYEVRTNNATLTGESTPVRKSAAAVDENHVTVTEMRNLALAGTNIASGTGKVVVVATGMSTQFGKIASMTQAVREELSPLQKEMARITRLITIVSVAMGLVFFVVSLVIVRMQLTPAFIFAIGVIVANVPEGLLPTVTLALAMGVQRMSKRNAIIKRLSSVETLGCTTVICTDKTGTLTQNAMTVREVWLPEMALRVTGNGHEPTGQFLDGAGAVVRPGSDGLAELLRGALLCNNARLVDGHADGSDWGIIGDPTEAALVVAAAKAGITAEGERKTLPRVFELPFESRRKRMATIHQHGKHWLAYVKGAPNEILKICTHLLEDGVTRPLTEDDRQRISAANDAYAQGALRVLAVARRSFDTRPTSYSIEAVETDLTFLGLLAMMDPPRPEVADAVARCYSAGIRTVMITGDYGLTAVSIAQKIGLVRGQDVQIITGAELETMDDEDLSRTLDGEVIFARVAPEHKLRVVTAFQAKGHIVAVTGDGVNDAPALKKADIGVAMGITGTDVAKEAADMILTDDNFASIVNAVEEGRAVYENIKKFVTYILASNVPELIPFVAMVLFSLPLGLTVMQILAIDLGTDMLPALALGVEKPEPGIMTRPPRARHKRLLDRALFFRAYAWFGLIESVLAFIGFYALISALGYSPFNLYADCAALGEGAASVCAASGVNGVIRVDLLPYGARMALDAGVVYVLATTIFHAGVVFAQIGNAFACRYETYSVFAQEGLRAGLRWLASNRFLLVGVAVEVVTMVLMVYVEPFKSIFEHAALAGQWWLLLIGYGPVLFLMEEARKAVARRWKPRSAKAGA